jgi:hypothetical protein
VFVGLATTSDALNKAMGAKYNPESKYGATICKTLLELFDVKYLWRPWEIKWGGLFHSLATLFGNGRVRDAKNGCCAANRDKEMGDAFVFLMDLYTIQNGRPMMKRFGHTEWAEDFHARRTEQKLERRKRMAQGETPIEQEILSHKDVV